MILCFCRKINLYTFYQLTTHCALSGDISERLINKGNETKSDSSKSFLSWDDKSFESIHGTRSTMDKSSVKQKTGNFFIH